MERRVAPTVDGRFSVALTPEERELLGTLPGELRRAFAANEPALYRLFPPAHVGDAAANAAYHELVGESLVEGRLAALGVLERTSGADTLSEDELESWLGALESLRLTLGTMLDVTEEPPDPGLADDDAARLAVYHWLSWLQEEVVEALSAGLDARTDD